MLTGAPSIDTKPDQPALSIETQMKKVNLKLASLKTREPSLNDFLSADEDGVEGAQQANGQY